MNKNSKILRYINNIIIIKLIIIFFINGTLNINVFAQVGQNVSKESVVCNTCGSPPAEFGLYQDFVYEVLSNINVWGDKGKYTGSAVRASWYQGGVFKLPDENINIVFQLANSLATNIRQKFGTMTATMAILSSTAVGWKSVVGGVAILFQPRPFVVAWSRLLKVDSSINQMIFDLGLSANWNQRITPDNLIEIQKVFDKYTEGSYRIFSIAKLENGVRYRHITSMLLRINSAMKTFIGSSASITTHFKDKQFDRGNGDLVKLQFDYSKIEQMKEQYKCARLLKCNESLKNFGDNIEKITSSALNSSKDSAKTISDAVDKFKGAFVNTFKQLTGGCTRDRFLKGECKESEMTEDQKKYIQDQNELLRSMYGLEANDMFNNAGLVFNKTRSLVVQSYSNLKTFLDSEEIKKRKLEKEEKQQKQSEEKINKKKEEEAKLILENRNKFIFEECLNKNSENFTIYTNYVDAQIEYGKIEKESITTCQQVSLILNIALSTKKSDTSLVIDAIMSEYVSNYEYDLQNVLNAAMSDVFERQKFDRMSAMLSSNNDVLLFFAEIYSQIDILNDILTDKNGIINDLGLACELQCQNKGGKCRY